MPVPSPCHAVLAVKGCARFAVLASCGRLITPDCLRCGVARRSRAIPPDQERRRSCRSPLVPLNRCHFLFATRKANTARLLATKFSQQRARYSVVESAAAPRSRRPTSSATICARNLAHSSTRSSPRCSSTLMGTVASTRTDLDEGEEGLIVRFPEEWLRDPDSPYLREYVVDVPWDEPELIEAFLAMRDGG